MTTNMEHAIAALNDIESDRGLEIAIAFLEAVGENARLSFSKRNGASVHSTIEGVHPSLIWDIFAYGWNQKINDGVSGISHRGECESVMAANSENLAAGIWANRRAARAVDPLETYAASAALDWIKANAKHPAAIAYDAIPSDNQSDRKAYRVKLGMGVAALRKLAESRHAEAVALASTDIESDAEGEFDLDAFLDAIPSDSPDA